MPKMTSRNSSQYLPDIEGFADVKVLPPMDKVLIMPKYFESQYNLIKEIRLKISSPVDEDGAHMLIDRNADVETQNLHCLIALLLSPRTKDEITSATMKDLIDAGLSVEWIRKTELDDIDKMISKVGMHAKKAFNMKAIADILYNTYDNHVPNDYQALLAFPGVGPKIAKLTMQIAFGENTVGISVDTHLHRIARRLGWAYEAKTPDATAKQLESYVPVSLWAEINPIVVGFGQTVCLPVRPKCNKCLLAKEGLCTSVELQ